MFKIRTVVFLIAILGMLTYMVSVHLHLGLYIAWLCMLVLIYWNGPDDE